MKDKFICYAVIVGFALGLAFLVSRPEWYSFAWWGVVATEALSIIENLRPILRKMGKTVQPLSRFLDTVATWIEKTTGIKADELQEGDQGNAGDTDQSPPPSGS